MSLFQIRDRFGVWRMLALLLLGLLFVALHVIRLPLRIVLWALTQAMRGTDYLVTGHLAAPDVVVAA